MNITKRTMQALLTLLLFSSAGFGDYEIEQIACSPYGILGLDMNERGDLTWISKCRDDNYGFLNSELYTYQNNTVSDLGPYSYYRSGPDINDNGTVAWAAYKDGINVFKDGVVSNIPLPSGYNSDFGVIEAKINNNDQIAWINDRPEGTDAMLWNGTQSKELDLHRYMNAGGGGDVQHIQITDAGDVIWCGNDMLGPYPQSDLPYETLKSDIYLHPGDTRRDVTWKLTNNGCVNGYPQISDNGSWVVFESQAQGIFPSTDPDRVADIKFLDVGGGYFMTLGSGQNAVINDLGQAVWSGFDGRNWQIYAFSAYGFDSDTHFWDPTVRQLTDGLFDNRDPMINDNGQIVWSGFDGCNNEIFAWDKGVISQLTHTDLNNRNPLISNNGVIAWYGCADNSNDIYLARNIIDGSDGGDNNVNPVPEPGSLALLGSGFLGLVGVCRRKFLKK